MTIGMGRVDGWDDLRYRGADYLATASALGTLGVCVPITSFEICFKHPIPWLYQEKLGTISDIKVLMNHRPSSWHQLLHAPCRLRAGNASPPWSLCVQ